MTAVEPEVWMDRAACADKPKDWFFPGSGGDTTRAKQVCALCPVRRECLAYALETPSTNGRGMSGVWGGTSELERRLMRRR